MSYYNNAYNSNNDFNSKIRQNQAQVNDLTNIMQQNIELALQRGENLNTLDAKTENLGQVAGEFRQTTTKAKKWYIWKNRKWTMILILVVLIIIALLAVAIGLGVGLSKGK